MENTNERQQEEVKPIEQVQIIEPKKKQSRFINLNDLHTIDLGNDDYVKIVKRFTWDQALMLSPVEEEKGQDIQKQIIDKVNKNSEQTYLFLAKVIREWNLVDHNGDVAPINIDHVRLLGVQDIVAIMTEANNIGNEQLDVPKDDASA